MSSKSFLEEFVHKHYRTLNIWEGDNWEVFWREDYIQDKDYNRLRDIYNAGNKDQIVTKARKQGKAIKDVRKSLDRACAAVIMGKKMNIDEDVVEIVTKAFALSIAKNIGLSPIEIAQLRMDVDV